jgi:hypothetical protein
MHRPKARQGKALKRFENPGEHRAPGGLNRHLEATDSQGEKGPEDEPLSRAVAWLCPVECAASFGLRRVRAGPRLKPGNETPAPGPVTHGWMPRRSVEASVHDFPEDLSEWDRPGGPLAIDAAFGSRRCREMPGRGHHRRPVRMLGRQGGSPPDPASATRSGRRPRVRRPGHQGQPAEVTLHRKAGANGHRGSSSWCFGTLGPNRVASATRRGPASAERRRSVRQPLVVS